jgi:excisionase family DNA binding protein
MEELMTLKEVARYLRLSPQTLYKMVEQGSIPALRAGALAIQQGGGGHLDAQEGRPPQAPRSAARSRSSRARRSQRDITRRTPMVLLLALASVALGVTGQLLFKAGAHTPVHTPGDLITNVLRPHTIVAFVAYAASIPLWLTVVSRSPLSYAYPLLGLNYVLVVSASAWVLGEPVSMHRWVGVGLVVAGFLVTATS